MYSMHLIAGAVFFGWPFNLYLFGQGGVLRWIRDRLDNLSGDHYPLDATVCDDRSAGEIAHDLRLVR